MRIRLDLAYDGTGFRGWAAQPGLRTVEGVLREALGTVFPSWSELAVATPAMKASNGLCVWSAIAKIGARVESDPSINPVIAGCTRCSKNDLAEAGSALVIFTSVSCD